MGKAIQDYEVRLFRADGALSIVMLTAAIGDHPRVSLVYYIDSGKITDAAGVVGRLHTLIGQITQKV